MASEVWGLDGARGLGFGWRQRFRVWMASELEEGGVGDEEVRFDGSGLRPGVGNSRFGVLYIGLGFRVYRGSVLYIGFGFKVYRREVCSTSG